MSGRTKRRGVQFFIVIDAGSPGCALAKPPSRRTPCKRSPHTRVAIVTAAMMASASGACAQDSKLSVPNVTVTAPAAPVEPPYMRDPREGIREKPLFRSISRRGG
jgi:hypothetical protein